MGVLLKLALDNIYPNLSFFFLAYNLFLLIMPILNLLKVNTYAKKQNKKKSFVWADRVAIQKWGLYYIKFFKVESRK